MSDLINAQRLACIISARFNQSCQQQFGLHFFPLMKYLSRNNDTQLWLKVGLFVKIYAQNYHSQQVAEVLKLFVEIYHSHLLQHSNFQKIYFQLQGRIRTDSNLWTMSQVRRRVLPTPDQLNELAQKFSQIEEYIESLNSHRFCMQQDLEGLQIDFYGETQIKAKARGFCMCIIRPHVDGKIHWDWDLKTKDTSLNYRGLRIVLPWLPDESEFVVADMDGLKLSLFLAYIFDLQFVFTDEETGLCVGIREITLL